MRLPCQNLRNHIVRFGRLGRKTASCEQIGCGVFRIRFRCRMDRGQRCLAIQAGADVGKTTETNGQVELLADLRDPLIQRIGPKRRGRQQDGQSHGES